MPCLHRLIPPSFPLLPPPADHPPFLRHRLPPCRASSSSSSSSPSPDDQLCFPSTSQPSLCTFLSSFPPPLSPSPPPPIHGPSLVYLDLQQSISLLEPPSRSFHPPSFPTSPRHAGRGKPMSLRMLKRKMQPRIMVRFQKERLQELMRKMESGNAEAACEGFGDSVSTAFASLICMLKMLQRHTLELRANLMDESTISLHEAAQKVQEEMQESLLWLFQQVFCCTPKLMLLLMVLLADFTVHSMSRHVAISARPPFLKRLSVDPASCSGLDSRGITVGSQSTFKGDFSENENLCDADAVIKECSCIQDDILAANLQQPQRGPDSTQSNVDENIDCEFQWPRSFTKECNDVADEICSPPSSHSPYNLQSGVGFRGYGDENTEEDTKILERLLQEAMSNEFKMRSMDLNKLNRAARQMLIAPVIAPSLEPDDYVCYDRTDLNYQYEIMIDPENSLLLANYAQFMHLVRHDNLRAEELFKRAVKADPVDGEIMARLASFLWVAKGDVEGADRAYKAALAADPANSFHAGCYAHFLWNSGQGENTTVPNSLSKHVTSA